MQHGGQARDIGGEGGDGDAAGRRFDEVGEGGRDIGFRGRATLAHRIGGIADQRQATFLAEGAHLAGAADPDPGEELEVVLVPGKELENLARRGVIRHALVIAAFYWKGLGEKKIAQYGNSLLALVAQAAGAKIDGSTARASGPAEALPQARPAP